MMDDILDLDLSEDASDSDASDSGTVNTLRLHPRYFVKYLTIGVSNTFVSDIVTRMIFSNFIRTSLRRLGVNWHVFLGDFNAHVSWHPLFEPSYDDMPNGPAKDAIVRFLQFKLPTWIFENAHVCDLAKDAVFNEGHREALKLIEIALMNRDPRADDQVGDWVVRYAESFPPQPSETLHELRMSLWQAIDMLSELVHHSTNTQVPTYLSWTPILDAFFYRIWDESLHLQETKTAIDFRTPWTTRSVSNKSEELTIITDVVFSQDVNLHVGPHRCRVPLMILEYAKLQPRKFRDTFDEHLHAEHLRIAMIIALKTHAELGLQGVNIFGILIFQDAETDSDVSSRPLQLFRGYLDGDGIPCVDSLLENRHDNKWFHSSCFDILYMRQMVLNACLYGHEALNTPQNQERLRHFSGSPSNITEPPLKVPPPIVGDPSMLYLIENRAPADMRDTRVFSQVMSESRPQVPDNVSDWLRTLFRIKRLDQIPDTILERCHRLLPSGSASQRLSEYLLPECQDGFLATAYPPVSLVSVEVCDTLPSDVLCARISRSLKLAVATQSLLNGAPRPGSDLTAWQTRYRSYFRAVAADEMQKLNVHCNPQWLVHRVIRQQFPEMTYAVADIAMMAIVPSVLANSELKTMYDSRSLWSFFAPELFLVRNEPVKNLENIYDTLLPLLVVEFVSDLANREVHVAHLGILMKSALALHKIYLTDRPVVGLLMDRNKVNVVVGWVAGEEDIILELPAEQLSFDLAKPKDVFALTSFITNLSQEVDRLQEDLESKYNEIAIPFIDGSYVSWRYDTEESADDDESDDELESEHNTHEDESESELGSK